MKGLFFSAIAACMIFSAAAQAATVADFLQQAKDKEGQGVWAGAVDIYNAILQQYPKEFALVYALRASDRTLLDDNKGAVADYTKALDLDNDPKDPSLDHGHIYARAHGCQSASKWRSQGRGWRITASREDSILGIPSSMPTWRKPRWMAAIAPRPTVIIPSPSPWRK